MKKTTFLAVITFLFYMQTNSQEKKHTYFIQTPILNRELITQVQEKAEPIIQAMIEKEMGIKNDPELPIFFFDKKRASVTLYYLRDVQFNNEPIGGISYLFLEPPINTLKQFFLPKNVSLSSDIRFFGEQPSGLFAGVFLVTILQDEKSELKKINAALKKEYHAMNTNYMRAYPTSLYDISESESHDYLPHLSLGILRINYIKYLINDDKKSEKIIDTIQKNILLIVSKEIENIKKENRLLRFDSVGLYYKNDRKFVHEINFKS